MLVGDRTELTITILTVESLRRTCDFRCCYKQAWLLDPVTGGYEGIWYSRGVLQGQAWKSLY